jgi:hypothetical protein
MNPAPIKPRFFLFTAESRNRLGPSNRRTVLRFAGDIEGAWTALTFFVVVVA